MGFPWEGQPEMEDKGDMMDRLIGYDSIDDSIDDEY